MSETLCDNAAMKKWQRIIPVFMASILIITLTACGGDSASPTPTPVPTVQVTPPAGGIEIPYGERPSGSFSGLTQRLALSGCRVIIPLEWTSFGDNTGVTPSRANFTINGGSIASDLAWERAVQLVASQAMRRGAETLVRGDDWVYAELQGNRGFTYRVRFADRFCDVALLGTTAVPAAEKALWPAIISSVEPEPPAS
jgi:hypothetical protein